jgi:hypothetical protein
MALAQLLAEEEVAAFEREGAVAEEAMKEAAKVAVGKMHPVAARQAVDEVAKEAAMEVYVGPFCDERMKMLRNLILVLPY